MSPWSTRSSTPVYRSMSRSMPNHRNDASGAWVRVLSHIERLSGASMSQKIRPSLAGVSQSLPISSMSVGMPASPSRKAVTAAP